MKNFIYSAQSSFLFCMTYEGHIPLSAYLKGCVHHRCCLLRFLHSCQLFISSLQLNWQSRKTKSTSVYGPATNSKAKISKTRRFKSDPFTCQITIFKLHFPATLCCNWKMPKQLFSVIYSYSIPMLFFYDEHRKIIFTKSTYIRKHCFLNCRWKKLILSFHTFR